MNRVLLRRIVCAVDLSDQSMPSFRRALELAELHGGELFVLHVRNGRFDTAESSEGHVVDAFAPLRRIANREPYHAVAVRWIMAYGNPAIEVARFIRRTNSDLAVVGGALPRLSTGVVGTVAHSILRTTGCPVLVIPRTLDPDAAPTRYREILCGVSSELSTSTLQYALSLAQEYEGRLTMMNVEEGPHTEPANGRTATALGRLRDSIPDTAGHWSVIAERVTNGDPARELVKAGRELEADLIVVGSTAAPKSDGGLGSVALGALTLTNASVLVVPALGAMREVEVAAALSNAEVWPAE